MKKKKTFDVFQNHRNKLKFRNFQLSGPGYMYLRLTAFFDPAIVLDQNEAKGPTLFWRRHDQSKFYIEQH